MKTNQELFKDIKVYEFASLCIPETCSSNCFAAPCDEPCVCDCDCNCNCDNCDCDVCDNDGCETCDYYE